MSAATTRGEGLRDAARNARRVDLAGLTGGAPILVLAPHPDDESLGCGGLIAACAAAGIAVAVALLTDGAGSHPGSRSHPPGVLARLRLEEMRAALAELGLGATALYPLGWPDGQAPRRGEAFARAVGQLGAVARARGAGAIVAAWRHDPHPDHAAAAAIAAASAAALRIRHLTYPVWGWMADTPVSSTSLLRLDIARFLPAKRRAIAAHRSQLGQVIADAPTGFTLPEALLQCCLGPDEIFLDESRA